MFPNPWVDKADLTPPDMQTLLKHEKYSGVHESIWNSL